MIKATAVLLVAALVAVARADSCDQACVDIYAPVCGSNGVTYTNDCALAIAACRLGLTLTVTAQGDCPPLACETACTESYAPVCGSDGVTYSSACELANARCTSFAPIVVLHEGACVADNGVDCPDMCTADYAPVCTKGGLTFDNLCGLRAARCAAKAFTPEVFSLAHIGRCLREDCPRGCDKMLRPVCGSDGRTYTNECILRQRTCTKGTTGVVAVSAGPCAATDPYATCASATCPAGTTCVPAEKECFTTPCPQYECTAAPARPSGCETICPMIWAPVCGSDIHTYSSECALAAAACERSAAGNDASPLSILHQGECGPNDAAEEEDDGQEPPLWTLPGFQAVVGLFAVLAVLSIVAVAYTIRKRRAAKRYAMVVMVDEKDLSMTEMVAHGSTNLRDDK